MAQKHPKVLRQAKVGRLVAVLGTTAALAAGAVVLAAAPASASVTSNPYSIGSPSGSVSAVTASPGSVTTGAPASFEVSFVTPTALSGSAGSWVSIAPSEALGSAPSQVAITGGSCIQTGTAGSDGAGTATATQLTVALGSSCAIDAGDTVHVYFSANAPGSAGSFYFTVTTSSEGTGATSNNISVGVSSASLTALHYAYGDNTTYTISGVTVGSGGAGSTVTLTAVATNGSGLITFPGIAGSYTVTVTPPGGSASTDTVQSAASSGSSVVLTLANPVSVGEGLTITAVGTNPEPGAGAESDLIDVSPNGAAGVETNSITFGNSVSNVSVTPSNTIAGNKATYVVTFKVTTGGSGEIFLSEPAGPTNLSTATTSEVIDNTQGWTQFTSPALVSANVLEVPFGATTNAGDFITLTVPNVTNPPAGTVGDFSVWTTNDPVAAMAAPFSIGANASPGVLVSVNPWSTGAIATYSVSNLYASTALSAGSSQIGLAAPNGTVWPNAPGDYSIVDNTSNTAATVAAALSGGGTNNVTLTVPINVASGDKLSITVSDVINPGTASASDTITLNGSVTGPAPSQATTTTTAPTTTTTTRPPTPKPSVRTTLAHVVKKAVSLRVYCASATCSGEITLTDVRTVVGSSKYSVVAGKSKAYTVGINAKGQKLIKSAKGHAITVTELVTADGGKVKTSRKIAIVG